MTNAELLARDAIIALFRIIPKESQGEIIGSAICETFGQRVSSILVHTLLPQPQVVKIISTVCNDTLTEPQFKELRLETFSEIL